MALVIAMLVVAQFFGAWVASLKLRNPKLALFTRIFSVVALSTSALTAFAKTSSAEDSYCPVPQPQLNSAQNYSPLVAIIIDDLGYQVPPAERLIQLHGELTLAIIPFSPYAEKIAEHAHQQGSEVMIHAPMETLQDRPWETSLTTHMHEQEIRKLSRQMIAAVPYALGLNNHGGSLLTQRTEHMGWLMDELYHHSLYFIDSRTSAETVASQSAKDAGVPQLSRDIFLDNVREAQAILDQLDKLEAIAINNGHAIGIGHPYPETLAALELKIPELTANGVQIIRVSSLLKAVNGDPSHTVKTIHAQADTVHPEGT